jgi:Cation efflux family
MAADGTTRVVVAALGANALIAVSKFVAASITGSAAMLSEALHSVADTANQGLLLFGMRRARQPADARHPFGYSKELYFWSFVVAKHDFVISSPHPLLAVPRTAQCGCAHDRGEPRSASSTASRALLDQAASHGISPRRAYRSGQLLGGSPANKQTLSEHSRSGFLG